MPVLDVTTNPVRPVWSVRRALVAEWFWALLIRSDAQEAEFAVRPPRFDQAPGLTERIAAFWNDGDAEYIELMVLAKRAGCLWEDDPQRLLQGLRSVVGSGEGDETYDSESPEIAALMRRRLERLAADPGLAEAWLALVAEVAAAVQPGWEADGCPAVEQAVRAQAPLAARATAWPEVPKKPGCDWGERLPQVAAHAVAAGGQVVVVPCWLGRTSFLLSFGDLVLVGVGVGPMVLPSDATREAARRLRALADPTRLALVELLAIRPRGVGDLARDLEVSQPTVSNHVRVLREAGVVRQGERPHQRQLTVDTPGLEGLLDDVRALVLGLS